MDEFEFIRRLRGKANRTGLPAQVLTGIGDDGTVIRPSPGKDLIVTTDLLIEDIDFRKKETPPDVLGHKALAVSLSDLAAMGSTPRWALTSLGVPKQVWNTEFLDRFYDGIFKLAERYQVKLIGGDTSRTPARIIVDTILIGECLEGKAVLRAGAKPGDLVYVTGELGAAAAGLRLLNRGGDPTLAHSKEARDAAIERVMRRQLRPEPRVGWGLVLGEEHLATAMIDISDGLSSDLHHLCEECKVGATIDRAKIPIDEAVKILCGRRALDPLMLALHGGEDFELLFTVSPENASRLPKKVDGVNASCIGQIEPASSGVRLAEGSSVWELEALGFQHFKN